MFSLARASRYVIGRVAGSNPATPTISFPMFFVYILQSLSTNRFYTVPRACRGPKRADSENTRSFIGHDIIFLSQRRKGRKG